MDKNCIIENGPFSYVLHVDGQDIPFSGMTSAEYFASHYKELGYEVIIDNSYWDNVEG